MTDKQLPKEPYWGWLKDIPSESAKYVIALQAVYEAQKGEIERLKQPTDVSCKVVTCQIYGHQIGLHYCENCNVTAEAKVEKS